MNSQNDNVNEVLNIRKKANWKEEEISHENSEQENETVYEIGRTMKNELRRFGASLFKGATPLMRHAD